MCKTGRNEHYLDSNGRKFWLTYTGISFVPVNFKFTEDHDLQILTAKAYIKFCCKVLKRPNKDITSYGYKHYAEDFGYELNNFLEEEKLSSYVSNGCFIKAAQDMQIFTFTIRNSPNCYFNLSTKK